MSNINYKFILFVVAIFIFYNLTYKWNYVNGFSLGVPANSSDYIQMRDNLMHIIYGPDGPSANTLMCALYGPGGPAHVPGGGATDYYCNLAAEERESNPPSAEEYGRLSEATETALINEIISNQDKLYPLIHARGVTCDLACGHNGICIDNHINRDTGGLYPPYCLCPHGKTGPTCAISIGSLDKYGRLPTEYGTTALACGDGNDIVINKKNLPTCRCNSDDRAYVMNTGIKDTPLRCWLCDEEIGVPRGLDLKKGYDKYGNETCIPK